jgi:hypothetical protein
MNLVPNYNIVSMAYNESHYEISFYERTSGE